MEFLEKQKQSIHSSPSFHSSRREDTSEPPSEIEQWNSAVHALKEMLERGGGVVSSRALRPELEKRGIEDATQMNSKLKLYNFDDPDPTLPVPDFRYHHRGRSYYSEREFEKAEAETEAKAEEAKLEEAIREDDVELEVEEPVRRKYRQEEAKLCKYVEEALENIYASDYGPDVRVAYDIHNERPGSEYENVDVIAVDWRSNEVVELVSIEVKLEFTPKLVVQACNYKRFAHRVWIALPVTSDEPGLELRYTDSLLFEHVVQEGLGILACRKRQGGAYAVWPINWPRLNVIDCVARNSFIENYRHVFEEASVVEPHEKVWRPQLR